MIHVPPLHGEVGTLPALTGQSWLTTWGFEPIPAAVTALVAVLYLAGVRRLRRRGDPWAPGRTVAFLGGGLGTIVIATQTFLAVYDTTLLWTHMVQHMLLSMVAPIFMALGAPITLALRTVGPRLRGFILAVLHSRYARVIGHPLMAGTLFVVNPWILYFTPLYEWTLRYPVLHDLNHAHFLMLGCLWFWSLVGIDPMPRAAHAMRLLAVFLSLPFHAFLGITLMSTSTIIASAWYLDNPRSWGPTLSQDQYLAGGVIWVTGDLLALVMVGVLFVQWLKASEREARRIDRELDRQEALRSSAGGTPPVESAS